MKNICLFILCAFVIGLDSRIHGDHVQEHIPEFTYMYELTETEKCKWEEVFRNLRENAALVEWIPTYESGLGWSEMLSSQYHATPEAALSGEDFMSGFLPHFKEIIFTNHPSKKTSWKVHFRKKDEAVIEYVVKDEFLDTPMEHIISKITHRTDGIYIFRYSRRHRLLEDEEVLLWVEKLRTGCPLIKTVDMTKFGEELSFIDKARNSLELGSYFREWEEIGQWSFSNGYYFKNIAPREQMSKRIIKDSIEIFTAPGRIHDFSQYIFGLQQSLKAKTTEKLKFRNLVSCPAEHIDFCSYKLNDHEINIILRCIMTQKGFYSFTFRKAMNQVMTEKQIDSWTEKLRQIESIESGDQK